MNHIKDGAQSVKSRTGDFGVGLERSSLELAPLLLQSPAVISAESDAVTHCPVELG